MALESDGSDLVSGGVDGVGSQVLGETDPRVKNDITVGATGSSVPRRRFERASCLPEVCSVRAEANKSILSAAASWMSAVVEAAAAITVGELTPGPHQNPSGLSATMAAKLDEIEWIIEWNLELRTWNLARSRFGLSISKLLVLRSELTHKLLRSLSLRAWWSFLAANSRSLAAFFILLDKTSNLFLNLLMILFGNQP